MIRTFIAIPLPGEIKDSLSSTIAALDARNPGVRWVKPSAMHLTLKFIGDIEEETAAAAGRRLDGITSAFAPLNLGISGTGVFPGTKRPRVVWVGINGDVEELVKLAGAIDRMCEPLGIKRDKRPFRSHITLGRLKVPSVIDLDVDTIDATFTARDVILYRSELLRDGARHTVLHTSSLGPEGG